MRFRYPSSLISPRQQPASKHHHKSCKIIKLFRTTTCSIKTASQKLSKNQNVRDLHHQHQNDIVTEISNIFKESKLIGIDTGITTSNHENIELIRTEIDGILHLENSLAANSCAPNITELHLQAPRNLKPLRINPKLFDKRLKP
jgi:hypothetical protein